MNDNSTDEVPMNSARYSDTLEPGAAYSIKDPMQYILEEILKIFNDCTILVLTTFTLLNIL